MISRFDFLYFIGAAAFLYLGGLQFYLRRRVDQLECAGKLTPDAASRIRRKRMHLIGAICILAGLSFLALSFVRL